MEQLAGIDPALRLTSAKVWASRYSAAYHRLAKDMIHTYVTYTHTYVHT